MSLKIYKKKTSDPDSAYGLHIEVGDTVTSQAITGLLPATGYTFKMIRAINGGESEPVFISATTQATPVENTAPSVTLVIDDNSITTAEQAILTATPADSDGTISKVEFYRGATLIGAALSAPFIQTVNGLAAGSYSFTAKAYDNDNASTVSSAVTLSVTEAPAAEPVTINLTAANFGDAGFSEPSGDYPRKATFPSVVFTTNATEVTLGVISDIYAPLSGAYPFVKNLEYFIDGVYSGFVQATQGNALHNVTLNLPPGTKTVALHEGIQAMSGGAVVGTYIKSLTYSSANSLTLDQPAAPADRIVILGDSITASGNATKNYIGYSSLLRTKGLGRVTIDGVSGRKLSDVAGDATLTNAIVSRLVGAMDGTVSNKLIIALGTNDVGGSSAATFKAQLKGVVDGVLAAKPSAKIYLQSLLPNNLSASLVQEYRDAVANLVAEYALPNVKHVVGASLMTATNLTDSVHPNDAGHAEIADNYFGVLTSQEVTSTIINPYTWQAGTNVGVATKKVFTTSKSEFSVVFRIKPNALANYAVMAEWLNGFPVSWLIDHTIANGIGLYTSSSGNGYGFVNQGITFEANKDYVAVWNFRQQGGGGFYVKNLTDNTTHNLPGTNNGGGGIAYNAAIPITISGYKHNNGAIQATFAGKNNYHSIFDRILTLDEIADIQGSADGKDPGALTSALLTSSVCLAYWAGSRSTADQTTIPNSKDPSNPIIIENGTYS